MGFTTFSGPIRAGTVREGANRNTGLVVLAQSWDTGDATGTPTGNYDFPLGKLPAGAQIIDIVVDQTVAATGGTTTVSVGTTSGGAELMAGVNSTAGGRFRGTPTAATQAAWAIGGADQDIFARIAVGTGTLTAGRFTLTILYVQRAADGSQSPSTPPAILL